MSKSWFQTGQEGRDRAKVEDEQQKQKMSTESWRFFLDKNGETAKVVFLDTPNFFFHEHNLFQITGKNDTVTCVKDFEPCPLDEFNNASYCVAGTIIDTRTTTDKKGVTYSNQKRLYVAKGKARQVILRRAEEHGYKLRGCVFSMTRGTNKNECATGEDIQFIKQLSEDDLKRLCPKDKQFSEWSKPLNYPEMLKPLPITELRRIAGVSAPVGSQQDSAQSDDSSFEAQSGSDASPNVDNAASIDDLL